MAQTVETRGAAAPPGLQDLSLRKADNPEFNISKKIPQRPFGPRFDPRFRRHVETVHGFGPYVLSCLLEEISAGADLRVTVALYANLDGGFIRAYGGDRFPPALHALGGGRR